MFLEMLEFLFHLHYTLQIHFYLGLLQSNKEKITFRTIGQNVFLYENRNMHGNFYKIYVVVAAAAIIIVVILTIIILIFIMLIIISG